MTVMPTEKILVIFLVAPVLMYIFEHVVRSPQKAARGCWHGSGPHSPCLLTLSLRADPRPRAYRGGVHRPGLRGV